MFKKKMKLFGVDVEVAVNEEGKIKEIFFLSTQPHEHEKEKQKRTKKDSR